MTHSLDHLVFVARDLDEGIAHVEELLGVPVQPGGQHQGRGTRNVLIGMGPDTFLEILSVDPDQPDPAEPRWLGVDDAVQPALVTWAAKSTDLAATVAAGRDVGVDLGQPSGASREKPDGTVISWGFTDPTADRSGGLLPFFLDWGETPHPGAALPAAVSFVDLTAEHPDPESLKRQAEALAIPLQVRLGDAPRLVARLETPRGIVELR